MKSRYTILALAVFISFFGCQLKGSATFPDGLLGLWKTSEQKYENCFLRLTKDTITFANTDFLDSIAVNPISKIEKILKKGRILYTIHYKNREREKYKFSFYYDPSKGGAIRFKNQEEIEWRKADAPSIEKLLMSSIDTGFGFGSAKNIAAKVLNSFCLLQTHPARFTVFLSGQGLKASVCLSETKRKELS